MSIPASLRDYHQVTDRIFEHIRGWKPGSNHKLPEDTMHSLEQVDSKFSSAVIHLFDQRRLQQEASALRAEAEAKRGELLQLATRVHCTESKLSMALTQARNSLAAASAREKRARHVTVTQLVDYAERISYSNAAPRGEFAMNLASKHGFREGWGTPAPQQHMLAASWFGQVAIAGSKRAQETSSDPSCRSDVAAQETGPGDSQAPQKRQAPTPHAEQASSASEESLPSLPHGWNMGGPLPPPPPGWKIGDPLPPPPPGWKVGHSFPAPPKGWKIGDPLPPLPTGANASNPVEMPGATTPASGAAPLTVATSLPAPAPHLTGAVLSSTWSGGGPVSPQTAAIATFDLADDDDEDSD